MARMVVDRRASGEVLRPRALNRALLARQMLLAAGPLGAAEAIEQLVGMQAQVPPTRTSVSGRGSRLPPGRPGALDRDRRAVRIALMRGTIHLVTAGDALALRPLVQPVFDATSGELDPCPAARGMDLGALAAPARACRRAAAHDDASSAELLHARWPDRDAAIARLRHRNLLPLVQVPPRGLWGVGGLPDAHLGRGLARPAAGAPAVARRHGAALPGRVRPGERRRRAGRGRGYTAAGRWSSGSGRSCASSATSAASSCSTCPTRLGPTPTPRAAPLPAGIRQPAALPRRPLAHRGQGRSRPDHGGCPGDRRNGAGRRVRRRDVEGPPEGWAGRAGSGPVRAAAASGRPRPWRRRASGSSSLPTAMRRRGRCGSRRSGAASRATASLEPAFLRSTARLLEPSVSSAWNTPTTACASSRSTSTEAPAVAKEAASRRRADARARRRAQGRRAPNRPRQRAEDRGDARAST